MESFDVSIDTAVDVLSDTDSWVQVAVSIVTSPFDLFSMELIT